MNGPETAECMCWRGADSDGPDPDCPVHGVTAPVPDAGTDVPGGSGPVSRRPTITNVRPADEDNQVVTVEGGAGGYRRRPCGGCPWRTDQTGAFPAEAFRISAPTAYDLAGRMFGCHESGADRPVTCAGFLLRGARHNMAVRMSVATGRIDLDAVDDGGHELHDSYRAMAEANGVAADDPVLSPCREP